MLLENKKKKLEESGKKEKLNNIKKVKIMSSQKEILKTEKSNDEIKYKSRGKTDNEQIKNKSINSSKKYFQLLKTSEKKRNSTDIKIKTRELKSNKKMESSSGKQPISFEQKWKAFKKRKILKNDINTLKNNKKFENNSFSVQKNNPVKDKNSTLNNFKDNPDKIFSTSGITQIKLLPLKNRDPKKKFSSFNINK